MARRPATLDVNAIVASIQFGSADAATDPDDAMLDAALQLLTRYGLRRWSMDDVAEIAGVGRATVYRRFPSRDELVHATIAREAHHFFFEVAATVAEADGVAEKVVEGFLVGMRMARETLVPGLFQNDKATALALFTSTPVLELGRLALVSQYLTLTGEDLDGPALADIELIAEVLVRLAMSFVLMPGSVIDFEDPGAAREALTRIVRPLVLPPENAPRPRSPRRLEPR